MPDTNTLTPAAGPTSAPGPSLIERSSLGETLSTGEAGDLLEYYLTNKGLPGGKKVKPLELTVGHGDDVGTFKCSIRAIEWTEWQDSIERATDKKTGDLDRFVAASWAVARALVTPKLGTAVAQLQAQAKTEADGKIAGEDGERISPPTDGAHLLRRMFGRQSGVLLQLSSEVMEISRLANDSQSVREVTAAKN